MSTPAEDGFLDSAGTLLSPIQQLRHRGVNTAADMDWKRRLDRKKRELQLRRRQRLASADPGRPDLTENYLRAPKGKRSGRRILL